jgi:hypothetical protein
MKKAVLRVCSTLCFVALSAYVSIAGAAENSCSALQQQLKPLEERELFYRLQGSAWQPVAGNVVSIGAVPTIEFMYVVREWLADEQERYGAIVIKTGRQILPGEEEPLPNRKRIELERLKSDLAECQTKSLESFQGYVSAQEYDRFHDYGYDASDTDDGHRLTQFHVRYKGRKGKCDRSTDSTSPDSPLRWDWRSNRSQFSFDPKVVSGGFRSQIVAGLTWGGAKAEGSIGWADQKVSIIKYHTDEQKVACIPIVLKLKNSNLFLHINDLEGLTTHPRLMRANELSLQITR